jgi:NTP pyrophosphatase (non-canonical NTP hydrolase)
MMTTPSVTISKPPHLTPDKIERLAYLVGELAEAGQAAAKILRHGYFSYDPTNPAVVSDRDGNMHPDNTSDLEDELGHVLAAIQMMVNCGDITNMNVHASKHRKLGSVKKWLHHQVGDTFTNVQS